MIEEKIRENPGLSMAIIGWALLCIAGGVKGGFVTFVLVLGFGLLCGGVVRLIWDHLE